MRYSTLHFSLLLLLLAGLIVMVACGGSSTYDAADDASHTDPVAEEVVEEAIVLTPYSDSTAFAGASLSLESPAAGATVPSGAVSFDFTVEGYELGIQTADAEGKGLANSTQGQHIHLIIDNGPYSAHYEADFEHEVKDGHHVALAFLSRSYHESVKEADAAVVFDFTVGDGEGEQKAFDAAAPHLFYSRPKGTYTGADTEKLMLDFYLLNTDLAPDGSHVRATIHGTEFVITEWTPHVIEGLPMGNIEIRLELIDVDGNPIPGPFNDVTRTVTLQAEAPADDP
ncbi:MAG: hypothetical protein AAF481_09635 [Acidobacteriota bacterium]